MSLHFKEGSNYDYTIYNGASKVSLKSFLTKPREVTSFIQLSNRIKGIVPEEFLFAQARHGNLCVNRLLDKDAMKIYNEWKGKYGDSGVFLENASAELKRFSLLPLEAAEADVTDILANLLATGEDCYIEPISWILQTYPSVGTDIRMRVADNVLYKMMLDKVIKMQRFYSYLCII
jgi:hypothetical protein